MHVILNFCQQYESKSVKNSMLTSKKGILTTNSIAWESIEYLQSHFQYLMRFVSLLWACVNRFNSP